MKKLFYIILPLLVLALHGCDPLDDTYNDLGKTPKTGNFDITLTENQYKSLKDKPGVNDYVVKDFYFANDEEAGSLIPLILDASYSGFDDGSSIVVNYNSLLFNFKGENKVDTAKSNVKYTVTADDYTANGFNYKNLTTFNDVVKILEYKYPDAGEYAQVLLTYTQYNSNTNPTATTTTRAYYLLNGVWNETYLVSNEDYASIDRGRYNEILEADIDNAPVYFNTFLKKKATIIPKKNDVKFVSYLYYYYSQNPKDKKNIAEQRIMAMTFNGTDWVPVTEPVVETKSLNFKKTDGVWKPDLTIRYELVEADYTYVAGIEEIGNAKNRENLEQYGNFSHRATGDPTYWSDEEISAAISAVLLKNFPSSEVGQKYDVTYSQYTGSTVDITVTYILDASGVYKVVEKD